MGMQYNDLEAMQVKSPANCPSLHLTNIMMQEVEQKYFAFADQNNKLCAMVMVINRVLDYQLKTPAIDLMYCVTTSESIIRKWAKYTLCALACDTNHDTIVLMDKAFLYFSRQTVCSSTSRTW